MFLGVAAGAFGAHGLKKLLSADMMAIFETGVRYQLIHGLALMAVAWLSDRSPSKSISAAGFCFLAGTLVFCGSLYILSLTGARWWGAVTPVGGLLFLAGWLLILVAPI